MRLAVYQLAFDADEYGDDAGKWIVVTEDGESEVTGPMGEQDARLFVECLNAVFSYERSPGRFKFGLQVITDIVKQRLK